MGIHRMNEYFKGFGLGDYTGIELGDKKGILAGPDYRDTHGMTAWSAGNTIAAAIGQSDNSFTPIQLANYISTVLNGGTRYSVHLLKEVRAYGEKGGVDIEVKPEIVSRMALSGEAVQAAMRGMRQVAENDSAVRYYMDGLPVKVGGKTGTAQRGADKNDNRLFVCAAPYNNPDIVISVAIEPDDDIPKDSEHGSSYACVAASYVLKEFYN
jgi:penicillin-binding protein 2